MEIEEQVTVHERARGLGILALDYLSDEQATTLKRILHPSYFVMPPERQGEVASFSAKASLAVLHGFIHGCIAEREIEAQRAANARAYAEEKVREERGFGFRPDS
jgi:hypothetical protein